MSVAQEREIEALKNDKQRLISKNTRLTLQKQELEKNKSSSKQAAATVKPDPDQAGGGSSRSMIVAKMLDKGVSGNSRSIIPPPSVIFDGEKGYNFG